MLDRLLGQMNRLRRWTALDIANFLKSYRDQVHFVNWISVRFYETGCSKVG